MSKFNFTYKSLYKIAGDVIGSWIDDESNTHHNWRSESEIDDLKSVRFSHDAMKAILTDTDYLNETELSVLYYIYDEDKSYRYVAKLVGLSHTKVNQIRNESLSRLKKIMAFFTSDSDGDVIDVSRLVDTRLDYDRRLTDVIIDHDIQNIYDRRVCFYPYTDNDIISYFINHNEIDKEDIETRRDEIERRLGLKDNLSEEFVKYTIDKIKDNCCDLYILQLLSSLDDEVIEMVLTTGSKRLYGAGLLDVIDKLEYVFGKRVDIILAKESKEV